MRSNEIQYTPMRCFAPQKNQTLSADSGDPWPLDTLGPKWAERHVMTCPGAVTIMGRLQQKKGQKSQKRRCLSELPGKKTN